MNNEIRGAVTDWMNAQGIRDPENMPVDDFARVRALLGNDRPGFGIFLSLIFFERQKAFVQLTAADLSNSAGAVAASKLQGMVQMVDIIRELVLSVADPDGEGSSSDEREVAGVRFDGRRDAEQQPVSSTS